MNSEDPTPEQLRQLATAGVPWKPPAFKYVVSGSDAIDFTVDD